MACLNESSLAPGVARLAEPHGLPSLPRANFHVLPERPGEDAFITQARALLASQFA